MFSAHISNSGFFTRRPSVPALNNIGIKTFFCGPESFTPDLSPILGEAPEIRRYFVAAGLNSIGILSGGGVGRALAHWIVNGRPDVDVRLFSAPFPIPAHHTHTNINGCNRFQPNGALPEVHRRRIFDHFHFVFTFVYTFLLAYFIVNIHPGR